MDILPTSPLYVHAMSDSRLSVTILPSGQGQCPDYGIFHLSMILYGPQLAEVRISL